jgi:hypothetical protein
MPCAPLAGTPILDHVFHIVCVLRICGGGAAFAGVDSGILPVVPPLQPGATPGAVSFSGYDGGGYGNFCRSWDLGDS